MRPLTGCCQQVSKVPSDCRLWPAVRQQYSRMRKRQNKLLTKRSRIWELSEPKIRYPKYQSACVYPEVALHKASIVRMEQPIYTRTEQLSYPQVSRLLSLKEKASFGTFNTSRKEGVNRLLCRSLHSLYSRLSNSRPEPKPVPITQWSTSEWEEHMKRIKSLAKPKTRPQGKEKKEIERKKDKQNQKPRKSLRRFKTLSKPKKYEDTAAKKWELTEQVRNYSPSERILAISKPKLYPNSDSEEGFRVKRAALTYKASQRIEEIAMPLKAVHKPETKSITFRVSPNALKAKTSKRIIELAEPKTWSDSNIRKNPFTVSRKALKARISQRLIQLAKPKTINTSS